MTGPVAQLVALACHANAVLQGARVSRFLETNSTCQFCDFVNFVRPKRWWTLSSQEEPLADNPDAWFVHLKNSGCEAVTLHHRSTNDPNFSDRMLAGLVGGGGRWLIETKLPKARQFYEAGWTVWNQDAPDRRIWRVTYRLTRPLFRSRSVVLDPAPLKGELASVLNDIEEFARTQDLAGFANAFHTAKQCLNADDPFALVYHKDLAPGGVLRRECAQLLAASQAAWVFGGMGSWNDLGFEGAHQKTYLTLSDRLFDLLNRVISAATNSTAARQ